MDRISQDDHYNSQRSRSLTQVTFPDKKNDPGVPSIECTINGYSFQKIICDTGSDVNIMAVVTYQLLCGTMPLQSTYTQFQMVDQTFRKVEGIVTDVSVKINDHFIPTDF